VQLRARDGAIAVDIEWLEHINDLFRSGSDEEAKAQIATHASARPESVTAKAASALEGYWSDDLEGALRSSHEAATEARSQDDPRGASWALNLESRALTMLGRGGEAVEVARMAEAASREAEDPARLTDALASQGWALFALKRDDEALAVARRAVGGARAVGQLHNLAGTLLLLGWLQSETGDDPGLQETIAELEPLNPDWASSLRGALRRPGWLGRAQRMYGEKVARERKLRELLGRAPYWPPLPAGSDAALGAFHVPRKWASYTPLDLLRPDGQHGEDHGTGMGGGYFLGWRECGIVIDPGVGFGRGFRGAGFVPRNMNAVITSHHHIDHSGELLAILTALFEMHVERVKHATDFHLAPGAFASVASVAPYVPTVRTVQHLRAGGGGPIFDVEGDEVGRLLAERARHRDLTGRPDASFGLVLSLHDGQGKAVCRVGITGDTRYDEEWEGEERRALVQALADTNLLVVHVGTIYRQDFGPEPEGRGEGDSGWHLGIGGTIRLLQDVKRESAEGWDPFVLLSEWGEEVGPNREEICAVVADEVGLKRVWPAELNAAVGLLAGDARPLCSECGNQYASKHVELHGEIQYLCDSHIH